LVKNDSGEDFTGFGVNAKRNHGGVGTK